MTKPIILLLLLISLIAIAIMPGCHRNQMVYSGPPPRTIPLDSVKNSSAVSLRLPDPTEFTLDFDVPGPDSCHVKINLHGNGTQLLRSLADSKFAPGTHTIKWARKDKKGILLAYGSYYYQFDMCGKSFTKSFHFRPQFKQPESPSQTPH